MTKKLHLGCGKCHLPGFLNVDLFSNSNADVFCDITQLPFGSDTFELVYASHVLEHLHRHMIVSTLHHWRQLLVDGGVLRLAVPNFRAIVDWYRRTDDLRSVTGLLYGGQNHPKNSHTITFDETTLTEDLIRAGFSLVRPWDWRTTEHAAFDDYSQAFLPHMDKDSGTLVSLNLEAVK